MQVSLAANDLLPLSWLCRFIFFTSGARASIFLSYNFFYAICRYFLIAFIEWSAPCTGTEFMFTHLCKMTWSGAITLTIHWNSSNRWAYVTMQRASHRFFFFFFFWESALHISWNLNAASVRVSVYVLTRVVVNVLWFSWTGIGMRHFKCSVFGKFTGTCIRSCKRAHESSSCRARNLHQPTQPYLRFLRPAHAVFNTTSPISTARHFNCPNIEL